MKRTYVRANTPTALKAAPLKVKRPATYHGMAAMFEPGLRPSVRSTRTSVVKLPAHQDYQRYAVAYGKPYAVVQDQSIIPFALQSKKRPLKRFELPFFKKKKRQESQMKLLAAVKPTIHVRTTAYTHDEWDHLKYGRKTALGTRLRFGAIRSAAADWSRYPVGTQFRIVGQPNVLYEVDDYGGALVGTGTIDLYKPTFSAMNRWGVRHVDIDVVKWGSFAHSLKVLKPRTKWSHVRRMVNSIHKQGSDEEGRISALVLHHTRKES
ncbi:MAG: 3D domain-containing protein [Verrucomicrobiales bacterium]